MRHLPQELVIIILEHGYYTSLEVPDRAFLATCSLVCTSWCAPAQSLLFREATKLQAFTAAVLSPSVRGILLGSAVRSLGISVGLYELALDAHSVCKLDQVVLAGLKEPGQGIRALKLLVYGTAWPMLSQLLGIWSRIQFLNVQQYRSTQDWLEREGASVALYELTLLGRSNRTSQPALLPWLLASSSCSLRILHLDHLPEAGTAARTMLELHAPRLRSLRVHIYNMDSAAFIRQCTVLEELAINYIPPMAPSASELPPSIEHLFFSVVSRDDMASRFLLETIEVLPKLRVLSHDYSAVHAKPFHILKARCVENEVPVMQYRRNWSEHYPVVPKRFPRTRTISDLQLMTS
ncbi:hypothetical protein BU15DRAFT_80171 [Melanogaster broomeanus]|nr:hypothetical protein BU15DRAFT_80171 [Melanogaster broomeanus]